MRARHVGFSLWLMLGLAACRQGGLDPEDAALLEQGDATTQATPGQSAVAAAPVAAPSSASSAPAEVPTVAATTLGNDVVMVGSELSAEGKAAAAKPVYALGDTVHASVAVAGRPAGKTVTIYWFDSSGSSVKMESKEIKPGDGFVNFSLGKADGMKAGKFSAQVDIDDVPAGMADFSVQ